MCLKKLFIFTILILNSLSVYSQSLSSYQWKNRLVLIQTTNPQNQLFKNQIQELADHLKGLEEIRIVVFKFTSGSFQKGFEQDAPWENLNSSLKKDLRNSSEFEIILIGLDGGVKLRKNEFLSTDQLFRLIDQMPMRQSEIRKKKDDDNK